MLEHYLHAILLNILQRKGVFACLFVENVGCQQNVCLQRNFSAGKATSRLVTPA